MYGCKHKIHIAVPKTGEVNWRDWYMDNITKERFNEDTTNRVRIIYKDSITIGTVRGFFGFTDTNGVSRFWDSLAGYTYADRKTKCFYRYPKLDPDCMFTEKWHQDSPDAKMHCVGWEYYRYWDVQRVPDYENISDTIIKNKVYRRIQGKHLIDCTDGKQHFNIETGFLLCERKGTIFHLDRATDEKEGCPLVMYQRMIEGTRTVFSREIEFTDRPLTAFELKIFAAWEKNAKDNPVK